MAYRRVETRAQFHTRIIKRCVSLADKYERRAAAAETEKPRQTWLSKAEAERRNAELHRRLLASLQNELIE